MRRSVFLLATVGMLVGVLAIPALAIGGGNPHDQVVVYVTSQGLSYDSIVTTGLPFVEGAPYQELVPGASPTGGLQTEFGPGDVGYLGGRWFVDANGDGVPSLGDVFFMCPLVGPGFVEA